MILGIIDTLNKWSDELREMMIEIGDNPLFWLCAFFFGFAVFLITFNVLNKNK